MADCPPGRAAHCGSTRLPCLCVSRRAMPRPTNGCGMWSCIVSVSWSGVRSPACAWRSTCRFQPLPASPSACCRARRRLSVILEHKDPALAVPLYVSAEADEALVQWRVWGNVLGLPLLIAEDGWRLSRAVRAAGPAAHRTPAPAPPPPQLLAQAQADDADAAQSRPAHRRNAGAPRRARDHRAQLNISDQFSAAASASRPTASGFRYGRRPAGAAYRWRARC